MTEPSLLPPRRELPAPTADWIRERVLRGTSRQAPPPRRWPPLAAAAAVVALVAGAVAVAGRSPDAPPAAPAPSASPVTLPSLPEVAERCGVWPVYDYVTRYQGDGAVTWLFKHDPAESTIVCTWRIGSTGIMASFTNDWYADGMAPARDGRLHVTMDDMMPGFETGATTPPEYRDLEPDRKVLVGTAPATVTKVVVEGPDGPQVAALASSWFLHHLRKPGYYAVKAYDAAGNLVDESGRLDVRPR